MSRTQTVAKAGVAAGECQGSQRECHQHGIQNDLVQTWGGNFQTSGCPTPAVSPAKPRNWVYDHKEIWKISQQG
ncbi:MAG TPA: hypothetical protein DCE18_00735 [Syntrophobacteraceae bacterium]|nr:hypothetical protein [Syntrophobacteraceae bacterium]HBZ54223.1 hypothetical protein [Syntrophobacteraceae bacterium]